MITEQQLQNALNKAMKKQKEELLDAFSKELKGVKNELKTLRDHFILVPIDKASNNASFNFLVYHPPRAPRGSGTIFA